MEWLIRVCVVLFTSVLATAYAVAQDSPTAGTTKRPSIGLVLEGGGAQGLAHIGVIQWPEEHRILVSYVAGTAWVDWLGAYTRPADLLEKYGRSSRPLIGMMYCAAKRRSGISHFDANKTLVSIQARSNFASTRDYISPRGSIPVSKFL